MRVNTFREGLFGLRPAGVELQHSQETSRDERAHTPVYVDRFTWTGLRGQVRVGLRLKICVIIVIDSFADDFSS